MNCIRAKPFLLLIAALASSTFGQFGGIDPGDLPTPAGAKITLTSEQTRYFLGENVLIHLGVENVSDRPFKISVGGDYNYLGVGREWNFRVAAVDEHGKPAKDPDEGLNGSVGGGMGTDLEVKPGTTAYLSVPLHAYRTIDRPGRYVVTVKNGLGWKRAEAAPLPGGTITLDFVEPTPDQARAVVQHAASLGEGGRTFGQKRPEFADFRWFSFPAYLPPLLELARGGDDRPVEGIGAIATPEATAALLGLLGDRHTKVAQAAGTELARRVPLEPMQDKEVDPSYGRRRQNLADHGWRPDLAIDARKFAVRTLNGDTPRVVAAATILGGLGTADDLPAVLDALDRVVAGSRFWSDGASEPRSEPGGAYELEYAVIAIVKRDAVALGTARPAQRIALARAVATKRLPVPSTDWAQTLRVMLDSDVPYEQCVALRTISVPIPEALAPGVGQRMASPKAAVQAAALELAVGTKDRRFGPAAMEALRTVGPGLLQSAFDAAATLSNRADAAAIVAGRLDEPGLTEPCSRVLYGLITGYRGGSRGEINRTELLAEGKRLKPLWSAFVGAHRDAIAAGNTFPIDTFDPAMVVKHGTLSIIGLNHEWPE